MTLTRTRLVAGMAVTALAAAGLTGAVVAQAGPPAPLALTADQLADLSQRYGVTGQAGADLDISLTNPMAAAAVPQDAPAPTLGSVGTIEAAKGIGATAMLGGTNGSWIHIHPNGTVARVSASGSTQWSRGVNALEKDWGLTSVLPYQKLPYSTTMQYGYNPFGPLASISSHPYAVTDLTGDGIDDVVVPFGAGFSPYRPVTIPGSTLKTATLLSVFDGATGATVYKRAIPGYVSGVAAFGRTVVVANMTGPSWGDNPVAEQADSRSNLTALRFSPGAAPTADVAWQINPDVPWARWNLLEPAGDNRLVAAWTDTPLGLGSPRPSAAHVLLVDTSTGTPTWQTDTPGYPRLAAYDAGRNAVVVAEQNDMTEDMRWDLVRFDASSGARTVLATFPASAPVALALDTRPNPDYLVASLSASMPDPNTVAVMGSSVRRVDADNGSTQWAYALAADAATQYPEVLGMVVSEQANTVIATVADPVSTRISTPDGTYRTRLVALNRSNGEVRWEKKGGAVSSALQLTQMDSHSLLTMAADQTAYVYQIANGDTQQVIPTLGEVYSTAAYDVNGDGRKDLIVGGLSHGVFAYDGRYLGDNRRELWHTATTGSVRKISTAMIGGRPALVVAATNEVIVLGVDGSIRSRRAVDGYAFTAVPADLDGDGSAEIVVPTDRLTAYSGGLAPKWTYQAPQGAGYFSAPAVDGDGRVSALYVGAADTFATMPSVPATAVGLDGRSGAELWRTRSAAADARSVSLFNGTHWSPNVPGTGGHTVALAFSAAQNPNGTIIELRDTRSGALVKSMRYGGAFTHNGFVSSAANGLVGINTASLWSIRPDLSVHGHNTLPELWGATTARAAGGREVIVTGSYGPVLWDEQQVYEAGSYPPPLANAADAIGSLVVSAADLDGDGADEILMNSIDWTTVRVLRQIAGGDIIATDNYLRGVSVWDTDGITGLNSAAAAGGGSAAVELAEPSTLLRFGADLAEPAKAPALGVTHDLQIAPAAQQAAAIPGYTPDQVRKHLMLSSDGAGQTVGIVIAYDVPNAESDLNVFSAQFGLPLTCGSAGADAANCTTFEKVYASGTPDTSSDTGWKVEAMLDLEWVHAVAPKAKLRLVLAARPSAAEMYRAVDVAAQGGAAVVNNSWGMSEFSGESFYDNHCKLDKAVCTFSTGDAGYPGGTGATSPYALAIGGTTLRLDESGAVLSETAWRGSGGGASYFTPRPAYQNGVNPLNRRGAPDVSEVADPLTGVAVYSTATGTGRWQRVGGTSLAAPIWSGILAVAAGQRSAAGKAPLAAGDGSVFAAVYGLTGLNDVTSGTNGACGAQCTAVPGYDFVTGRGTPRSGIDVALSSTP